LADQASASQRHQQHRTETAAQATADMNQQGHHQHIDQHARGQLHAVACLAMTISQDNRQYGAQQV
jgi:hypothetical protein